MRLASINTPTGVRTAAVTDGEIVDLHSADPRLPADMLSLLATPDLHDLVGAAIESGRARSSLSTTRFLAPVPRPPKFLAVGLNYADHAAEVGESPPAWPTIFNKLPTCVAGPYDDVESPNVSSQLDYEGELAFVIGQRCRDIPRERADQVIAGYTIVNDFSVRDWQLRTSQWLLGKSFGTHGVIGPWIVTRDELDAGALELRTIVNGEVRQQSNTRHLIHDCAALVALVSSVCELEPGDILATGTPNGVGMAADPPSWLVPGDVVRVELEGIGAVENRIIAAPVR